MRLGRDFWLFWAAGALTNLGDGIRMAAFPLLAAALTDDPLLVGAVAAAGTVPWVVTGLLAGSMADRLPARRLMLLADVGRGLVMTVLVALVLADAVTVAHVALAAFLLGVGETVRDTTSATVVPRLVAGRLLERANGRLVGSQLVANEFAGPLVGAALFALGAALPFALTGGVTALGALLLLMVPTAALAHRAAEGAPPVPRGLLAGLPVVLRSPVLRVLLVTSALTALADAAWFSVLVLWVDERLGLGEVGFGLLLAAGAAGGLLGATLADRVLEGGRHRQVVGWSAAVAGGAPVLLGLVEQVWAAVVVVSATSAAFALFNVASLSLRQRLVPDGLLGRVVATWRVGVYGAGTVGFVVGGALAQAAGLSAPFVASGVVGAAAAVLWWARGQVPVLEEVRA